MCMSDLDLSHMIGRDAHFDQPHALDLGQRLWE